MINNIELNHLKYFYFTVLEGGVAQAANRLCVQQPVVSKMLKNLESNLDQELFWKKGRTKSLTDYGQLIFRHCQVVFGELDKISGAKVEAKDLTGVFNIGACEPVTNFLFPDVIKNFKSVFNNLNLNVYTSTQTHLLEMISGGKLNAGCFFYASNIPTDLTVIKKIPFKFSFIVKTCVKDKDEVLNSFIGSREIDDLSTHSFPTLELLRKKHPEARITFSSNSISLHKSLVLKEMGVAILPNFMVEKEIKKGSLTELYPNTKFEWDLMIIGRKSENVDSILFQNFLKAF